MSVKQYGVMMDMRLRLCGNIPPLSFIYLVVSG